MNTSSSDSRDSASSQICHRPARWRSNERQSNVHTMTIIAFDSSRKCPKVALARWRVPAVCFDPPCDLGRNALFQATPSAFAPNERSVHRLRQNKQSGCIINDPQPDVVRELYPWTAMCVRNVDVHVSCSSQVDAQLAAFFIDPRAK